MQQETDKWNKERESYLKELQEDLEELEKKASESDEALLKHVYQKHPPKIKKPTLGAIPEVGGDKLSYRKDMKVLFRNALIHYHPDRVDIHKDGVAWKVLCEEISKRLSSRYESFK